jgi:hypothetical protein
MLSWVSVHGFVVERQEEEEVWSMRRPGHVVWLLPALLGLALHVSGQEPGVFPLREGLKRVYRTQRHDTLTLDTPVGKQAFPIEATGDLLEEIAGQDAALFDAPVTVVETRVNETSARGQSRIGRVTTYYRADTEGIARVGARSVGLESASSGTPSSAQRRRLRGNPIDHSSEVQKYSPPLRWLKLPRTTGSRWEVGTVKTEGIALTTTAEAAGTEDVTVPAQVYRGCSKVVYRHTRMAGQLKLGSAVASVERGQGTTTVWLAPGIGPVKEQVELTGSLSFRSDNPQAPMIKGEFSLKRGRELTKVETPSP